MDICLSDSNEAANYEPVLMMLWLSAAHYCVVELVLSDSMD